MGLRVCVLFDFAHQLLAIVLVVLTCRPRYNSTLLGLHSIKSVSYHVSSIFSSPDRVRIRIGSQTVQHELFEMAIVQVEGLTITVDKQKQCVHT